MPNHFFLLPLHFDPQRLAQDLATCESDHWTQHFNQRDYVGEWTGVALRSTTGRAADIYAHPGEISPENCYTDTPLLAQCPYFRKILARFHCEIQTVRLLALSPGSAIKEHRDLGLGYKHGAFRLHIPIETDAGVRFRVGGSDLAMGAGECWYANFDLPHSVLHEGTARRVHLVIDGRRNAWSDALFRRAGYDFAAEQAGPVYDEATRQKIIAQLTAMDTDVARQLMAGLQLSVSAPAAKPSSNESPLHGWFPVEMTVVAEQAVCRWMYLGDKSFTEPIFKSTLSTCGGHPNNARSFTSLSSPDVLFRIAADLDVIPPAAFIFHVSRCGSTLLSQLLGLDKINVVLAEAALIDHVLRWPYQHPLLSSSYSVDTWLDAAIRALGQRKTAQEEHLFIKLDSWHLFFYPVFRRLYPEIPFILLYRTPDEVLRSHQKQRGFQVVPGALEPGLFGSNPPQAAANDLDTYCCKILERHYTEMVRLAATDTHCHLANYAEGTSTLLRHLAEWTNWPLNPNLLEEMDTRRQYHAKHPSQLFNEVQATAPLPEALAPVLALYHRLEEMRKT